MSWGLEVLALDEDADERTIKRAYAQRLRVTRPDDDPAAFQQLHEAYQAALAWVQQRPVPLEAASAASAHVASGPEPALEPAPAAAPAPADRAFADAPPPPPQTVDVAASAHGILARALQLEPGPLRDWLAQQLRVYQDNGLPAPLQPGEGGMLPLRGELLPVRWQEGRFARLEIDGNGACVQWPTRAGDATLRRLLREFYEAQTRADVGRWLPKYLPGLPRAPSRVRLKVMSSQWGSLAPDGSMALDLALVLGRPDAFEYVLVHELCHLIQPNHSPAFWHEVEQRFPAWREQRDYFQLEGRRLKAMLRQLL